MTAAAEYLHIAQPSLSLAIKELESEFGTPLFQRAHRGMHLTEAGRQFLDMSRDIVGRMESAEKRMKDLGRDSKELTLGIPPMIGSLVLPVIYSGFISENPDVRLQIVECGREEMRKKIADGQLDMAFIAHDRSVESDVASLRLGTLELVCAATPGRLHPKGEAISAGDLADTPLVLFKDGFFQTNMLKAWFAKSGVEPLVLLKTDQLSTLTKLIASGTAAGFLFRRLPEESGRLDHYPLSPPLSVGVSLLWQKNAFFSSSMKRFKAFLEKTDLFS